MPQWGYCLTKPIGHSLTNGFYGLFCFIPGGRDHQGLTTACAEADNAREAGGGNGIAVAFFQADADIGVVQPGFLDQLFGGPGVKAVNVQEPDPLTDGIGLLAGKPRENGIDGMVFQRCVLGQEVINTLQ